MSEAPTIPPFVNNTMKFMLRSPFHGIVSKSVLLISFTGCRSGKTYTTPVSYSQENGFVSIFTHATWWKNLCANNQVRLLIRGRVFHGMGEPVEMDKKAIASGLTAHLRKVPSDARYYGVSFDADGNPKPDEIQKAVQTVVMIRVHLNQAPAVHVLIEK